MFLAEFKSVRISAPMLSETFRRSSAKLLCFLTRTALIQYNTCNYVLLKKSVGIFPL